MTLIFCGIATYSVAQDKLDFGDTPTTNLNPKYKSDKKDYKAKRPVQWVKNSPKDLMLGNPCMDEVTDEMGFVYVVQTKNQTYGRMSGFARFWHNLAAKSRIMLKNGPLWKFKLKRKRKRCEALTNNYMG